MQPSIDYRRPAKQSQRGQFHYVLAWRRRSSRKTARPLTTLSFMVNRSNGGSFEGAAIRLSVVERLKLVGSGRTPLAARDGSFHASIS